MEKLVSGVYVCALFSLSLWYLSVAQHLKLNATQCAFCLLYIFPHFLLLVIRSACCSVVVISIHGIFNCTNKTFKRDMARQVQFQSMQLLVHVFFIQKKWKHSLLHDLIPVSITVRIGGKVTQMSKKKNCQRNDQTSFSFYHLNLQLRGMEYDFISTITNCNFLINRRWFSLYTHTYVNKYSKVICVQQKNSFWFFFSNQARN